MKSRLSLFLAVLCCTLLSSIDAYSVVVNGKGTEMLVGSEEEVSFTSQTEINHAGLRTAEARLYFDDDNMPFLKSVTTFNSKGQIMLRTFFSLSDMFEWVENGEQIIFRYNRYGQLVEKTTTNAYGIVQSYLYEYDAKYYEEHSAEYLTGWLVWDAEAQNYVSRFSLNANFILDYSDFDAQGRVLATYNTVFENAAVIKKSRTDYVYNDKNGEVLREVSYNGHLNSDLYDKAGKNEYTYYPGSSNVKTYIEYYYDAESKDFFPKKEEEYEYNAMCKMTIRDIYLFDAEGNKFHSCKHEYTYNKKGLEIGHNQSGIDENGVPFFNAGATVYDSNDRELECLFGSTRVLHTCNDNVEIVIFSEIIDEEEVEYEKKIFYRDEQGRVLAAEHYFDSYDGRGLVLIKSEEIKYNDNQQLVYITVEYVPQDADDGSKCLVLNVFSCDEASIGYKFFAYQADYEDPYVIWGELMTRDAKGRPLGHIFVKEVNNILASGNIYSERIEYEQTITSLSHDNAGIIVRGGIGRIEVFGAEGRQMRVVSANGVVLYNDAAEAIAMRPGLYVVEIDGVASKVIVR